MVPKVPFKAPALGTEGLGENNLHLKSITTKSPAVWWKKTAKHPKSPNLGRIYFN